MLSESEDCLENSEELDPLNVDNVPAVEHSTSVTEEDEMNGVEI